MHFINSSSHTIDNHAGVKLAMDEIQKAIKGLDYEHKTPFMMHFQGYKYFEIADILNIPIGTVKNRIHIARKELKGQLKSYKSTKKA